MKTRFIPWKSLAVIALAAHISGSDKLLAEQQDSTVTALGKEFVSSTVNVNGTMLHYVRGGTGRRWDVLAWNRAAAAVFGDYTKIPERERNIVRLVFTAPEYRQLMVDWESDARRVLALFRADYGRHTGDHDFEDLTNELRAKSAEFRVWWAAHDIAVRKEGRKEFRHHEVGRLMFEHTAFYVADDLNLKLVIYTPLGETANKVTRLLSSMPPNALSPQ